MAVPAQFHEGSLRKRLLMMIVYVPERALDCPKVYACVTSKFMRNWMRDRLMRRKKKKDGDAEQLPSDQPKQAPLQPELYDAQRTTVGREAAPPIGNQATPARTSSHVDIDDDNRWNRVDGPGVPAPRRAAPARVASVRRARVEPEPAAPEMASADAGSPPDASEGAEGRPSSPNRGRRRRSRRGRGRSKPSEVSQIGNAAQVTNGVDHEHGQEPEHGHEPNGQTPVPRPVAAAAVAQDPSAPKKYKGVTVLAIGLPGSGKSSWFKRNNITPLSSDLLRGLLFDDPNEQRFQDLVFSNLRSLLRARMVARRPMNYVDATNLSPHERQGWIKLAHDYGYEVHAVFFDVPLEVCLERNQKRQRVVAEDVMRRMASKLRPPTFEEGFTKITNVRVKKKEAEAAGAGQESEAEAQAEVAEPAVEVE